MNVIRESNVALAESATEQGSPNAKADVIASVADFPEFAAAATGKAAGSIDHLLDVSVSVTAELGRITMTIGDILKLGIGSVVGLDRGVSEPVDLLVQGVPFAHGEVVVVDRQLAIRIREILDPKLAVKR
jgi:flagellar motor switch protein FliN/FliY